MLNKMRGKWERGVRYGIGKYSYGVGFKLFFLFVFFFFFFLKNCSRWPSGPFWGYPQKGYPAG